MDLTPAIITTQYVELLFFFLQYVVYFVDKTFLGLYRKKSEQKPGRKTLNEIDYQRQK
jgi:hypothetical protein